MVSEMPEARLGPADPTQRTAELERMLDSLREDSEVAHVLLGLSGALAEVRTIEETLELTVRVVPDLLGADRCLSARIDRRTSRLEVHATSGFEPAQLESLLRYSGRERGLPLLQTALEEGAPILIPDASADPRFDPAFVAEREIGAFVGIPLMRWGEEFGGLGLVFDRPRPFSSKDKALTRGIARQVGVALVNARRFNLLGELRKFGHDVAVKLRLQSVIDVTMNAAASLLTGDSAAVYFLDRDQQTFVAAGGNGAISVDELARIDAADEPWSALMQSRTVVVPDLDRLLGLRRVESSAVAAPIPGEDGPVGAIVVFFRRHATMAPDEAEALSVLATEAAMAIDNANRFERQHRVTRSLQLGLLQSDLPEVPGFSVGAVYEPASGEAEIGGDFYDLFDLEDGRFAVTIGDVSGKGAEAAARTATAKYMLRAFSLRNPAPSSALFHLNNALARDMEAERFATLVYGVIESDGTHFTVGLAGHPSPIVYRKATGTAERLDLQGAILGVIGEEQYQQETLRFSPGDCFVAFTDGLLEARSGDEFFGRKRLEDAVAAHAAALSGNELARQLLEDARSFGEIRDDAIVFVLRNEGPR
jgi:sigma-B regulation protein RsbU (phosphoserine phosphatase)